MNAPTLTDRFSRTITYLRLSVTDRCDFRCTYCMAEDMTFLPKSQLLSLEEMAFIANTFIALGVTQLRITGGEPLIKRDIHALFEQLDPEQQLQDLCITTNGSRLAQHATMLKAQGVTRINISLDSLQPTRFKQLTRTGELQQVLQGIEAARACDFERIKLNTVMLRGQNDDEALDLVRFAVDNGLDISFIEEMPLGAISEHSRKTAFLPSHELREHLANHLVLTPSSATTGGPSRYWQVQGHSTRVGFISPHSHNFCSTCNRVRLTAEGQLLLCLGNEHSLDLRAIVRERPFDANYLTTAIIKSLEIKPEQHHFEVNDEPQIVRFMNATGG